MAASQAGEVVSKIYTSKNSQNARGANNNYRGTRLGVGDLASGNEEENNIHGFRIQ